MRSMCVKLLQSQRCLEQPHGTACFKGASNMLDLIMLVIGLGFFVLSVGYVYAC
jgi:hypothetical protein